MSRSRFATLLAASLVGTAALSQAAGAQDTNSAALAQLEESLPGELINDPTSLAWNTQGDGLKVTSVTGEEIPGGGAASHFDIRRGGDNVWSVQAYVPLTKDIASGETVTLGFWARTAEPPNGGKGRVSIRIQDNVDPWPGFGDIALEIEPEWKWYEVSVQATRAIPRRNGVMVFQMGGVRQQLEIGQTIIVKGADKIQGDGTRPQAPLPPQIDGKGPLVSLPDSRDWTFFGPDQTRALREDRTIYLGRAARFTAAQAGENAWDIHANIPLTEEIKEGDRLLIAVAAKTVSAQTDDGRALIGIRVQKNEAPYEGFADNSFKVGPNWQLIQIRTTATIDVPAGTGLVVLHFAGAAQEVDVGPVYVLKLPAE
jgi:hypothetical protein